MEKLRAAQGTPDIKVLTGIRRCGKSTLLEAFSEELRSENRDTNIIWINFNEREFEHLTDRDALYNYIETAYSPGLQNVVMIDEVQMCKDFEKTLNYLHASNRYDIYITGSNAFLQSSDLATLFTGRTFEIAVYPFSLTEFMSYFGFLDPDEALPLYRQAGGMPGSYKYASESGRNAYLQGIWTALVVRDIQTRYGVRNLAVLERLIDFLFDNISGVVSIRNVCGELSKTGIKVNAGTIGSYMRYLEDAFAFYKIHRYDTEGKRYLNYGSKYYLADHAFRTAILGNKDPRSGRTDENIVALELLRRGYRLYAGMLYGKEIDFVAMRPNEKLYIQVSSDISSDATLKRELDPLLSIHGDAYPRILLSNTHGDSYTHNGVQIINLVAWLTDVA